MPRIVDAYSFPARVLPVVLVVIPPLVLLGAGLLTGLERLAVSGLILTAGAALAAQLGRDRGKRLEPGLWAEWGGSPTLRRLRYAGCSNVGVVDRLHERVSAVVGEPLPSQLDEEKDPADADVRYQEVTRRLIGLTRDRARFDLLFKENVNYGQRRNLLGLRPFGIGEALITLGFGAILMAIGSGLVSTRAPRYGPGVAVALIAFVIWTWVVNSDWVRVPAEAYADRLMESVDVLQRDIRPPEPESRTS